jgi:hypothetical protein
VAIEYRLTWEVLDPFVCATLKDLYGKSYWTRPDIREAHTVHGKWHETSVVFRGDERMHQYRTLKEWEEKNLQPVRKVVLEQREAPEANAGWTKA